MVALQQFVLEIVLSEEQSRSQAEGIQVVDVPNIEPKQLMTTKIPFHYIPTKQEEQREPHVPLVGCFLTLDLLNMLMK